MLLPFTKRLSHLKTDFDYRHNRHFSQLISKNLSYKSNESFYPISQV